MALLSDLPRSAPCLALTEVLALRIDRDDFLELLAERSPLALGIIKVLTRRLTEMTRKAAGGR
jgi:CRP-like cAMP-binding protein